MQSLPLNRIASHLSAWPHGRIRDSPVLNRLTCAVIAAHPRSNLGTFFFYDGHVPEAYEHFADHTAARTDWPATAWPAEHHLASAAASSSPSAWKLKCLGQRDASSSIEPLSHVPHAASHARCTLFASKTQEEHIRHG